MRSMPLPRHRSSSSSLAGFIPKKTSILRLGKHVFHFIPLCVCTCSSSSPLRDPAGGGCFLREQRLKAFEMGWCSPNPACEPRGVLAFGFSLCFGQRLNPVSQQPEPQPCCAQQGSRGCHPRMLSLRVTAPVLWSRAMNRRLPLLLPPPLFLLTMLKILHFWISLASW